MNKIAFARLISFITKLTGYELSVWNVETINNMISEGGDQLPVSSQQVHDLIDALANIRKIDAIKLHRQMTGYGLKESKDQIERVYAGIQGQRP